MAVLVERLIAIWAALPFNNEKKNLANRGSFKFMSVERFALDVQCSGLDSSIGDNVFRINVKRFNVSNT